jgi:prophage DNA circulation protein
MKKLSKEQAAAVTDIAEKLREAWQDIEGRRDTIEQAVNETNELIDAYNAIVAEANEFASGIGDEIDNFMSDKSDKWNEGDTGNAYDAWRSEWQGFSADELEPVTYEASDEPSHADDLENLPQEPEK